MKIKYIAFLLFLTYGSELFAQTLKVTSIQEFVKRFNLSEASDLYKSGQERNQEISTKRIFKTIFDNTQFHLDSSYQNFVRSWEKFVDSSKLSLLNNRNRAIVEIEVLDQRESKSITLDLVYAEGDIYENSYEWKIISVDGDLAIADSLLIPKPMLDSCIDSEITLHPYQHMLFFHKLKNILEYQNCIHKVCVNITKPSKLTSFINKFYNRELEFKRILNTSFKFNQIDGWSIIIQEVNRKDGNSGWLITKLVKEEN